MTTKQVVIDRRVRMPNRQSVKECGSVYINRRWVSAEVAAANRQRGQWGPALVIICPACKRHAEGVPSGYVYLDGSFLEAHLEDISTDAFVVFISRHRIREALLDASTFP